MGDPAKRAYLSKIDRQTRGNRYDVTPLFADAAAFDALVDDLVELHRGGNPDRVACVDALGFILGTAIARELGLGVIPLRKGGKLPVIADSETFVDYSGREKTLELRPDAIGPHDRVLLVDEWIETGSQIGAAIRLIERSGGVVVGIATIHMEQNPETEAIGKAYRVGAATRLDADREPALSGSGSRYRFPEEETMVAYLAMLRDVLVDVRFRAYQRDPRAAELLDAVENVPDLLARWPDMKEDWVIGALEAHEKKHLRGTPRYSGTLRDGARDGWQLVWGRSSARAPRDDPG